MIVAGIGCRKGATTASVIAAINAALMARDIGVSKLAALAALQMKAAEPGIVAAAKALSLDLVAVNDEGAATASVRAATHSTASLDATGTRSASETAALAAAGPESRLLGPRLVLGDVTCALAESGEAS